MSALTDSALLTDLYELTMLQGYFDQAMDDTAIFEFFVRKLPPERGFLLAAGLEQVLDYLQGLQFSQEDLAWLADTKRFSPAFLQHLEGLRYTGDVHAIPEGSVFFANEPILRVTAPISQAQLVESRVINLLHVQILVASKAARCVLVAPGKLLLDFGMRRAHGAEAALFAARASYLAGFSGTATVLAHKLYGVPSFGTMAHSFVQAHDSETDAFRNFARSQPDNVVLLIDTYDTLAAAHKVVQLARELRQEGIAIKAVRLDSGDLASGARDVRRILDDAECGDIGIFCSGSLDEYRLRELLEGGAPVDGFGVGTNLDVSADAPYLDCVYKLQEYAGRPRRKRSVGKATWPGRKQVFRCYDASGIMSEDVVTVEGDEQPGEALIQPVMRDGERTRPRRSLDAVRAHAAAELARLPGYLCRLESESYTVEVAEKLRELAGKVDRGLI
jgi:nicotinate phosphoribosyltransferase